MPRILLIDNGSSRADSTLTLRRLSAALGERLGAAVDPVSLLHAHKVPAEALGGRPADTLEPYLRRAAQAGGRDFLAVPLFFGPSRALADFVPEIAARVGAEAGPVRVRVARELCPLPQGEPRLVDILADHLRRAAGTAVGAGGGGAPGGARVVLADHGSPIPQVTAVRRWVAQGLAERLGREVHEAVMERREGADYDFNGSLLAEVLESLARGDEAAPIVLGLLFLAPGRHAGPGGDIAEIVAHVRREHPALAVTTTPLVAEHPLLIDILADRARDALAAEA